MIPYGRQEVTDADIEMVKGVLKSDYLTQGPLIPRFEETLSRNVGSLHGVALNSGTSALHVACMALGLGPGDCLWTVPNTFVASANCARYCGADVDFVDIDHKSWNMSIDALQEKLESAEEKNSLPKIIVPVHFAGQPTRQQEIWNLGKKYGFYIIEDACHAVGASRFNEPVGSCRWSDITVFSFHPVKIITSAEGGMATTNNKELAQSMTTLRSHGITRDRSLLKKADPEPWYYEMQTLGFNYRMTDMQAALGISQLERLSEYVKNRNDIAGQYHEAFADLPIDLPFVEEGNLSSYHLYVIRIGAHSKRKNRDLTRRFLTDRGVGTNLHYIPVHLQPYYQQLGFSEGICPEAEKYAQEALTIPLFPSMTETEIECVKSAVRDAFRSDGDCC